MTASVLEISDLRYEYKDGAKVSLAVVLEELTLKKGGVKALTGVSGSGKSTLLECIGLVRKGFEAGIFTLAGQDPLKLSGGAKSKLRAGSIGFMPQTGGLLPFLTVRRNLKLQSALALKARGSRGSARIPDKVMEAISALGMADKLDRYPKDLSIGQRQRAVFFKAVVHEPALVLIDEPTSALDPVNAQAMFELIKDLSEELGLASLVITHDLALVKQCGIPCVSHVNTPGQENLSLFRAEVPSCL